MELPDNAKQCEKVFLAQPKAHHVKDTEKLRVVETNVIKLQEFFKGHDTDVCSGEYKRLVEGKKKAMVIVTTTTIVLAALTIKIDRTRTGMTIGLMNNVIMMMVLIMIVTLYVKTVETMTITLMRYLVILMIKDTSRARINAEIATRVAIMPTTGARTTRTPLTPAVLTLPTGKS